MKRRSLLQISALLVAESLGLLRVSHAAERGDRVRRIAFVGPSSPSTVPRAIHAFWERLRELGWIQDKNVIVDLFWANGQLDRLPTLMSEAVGRSPDVIVTYTTPAGLAAKKATAAIPIVDAMMGDPIRTGLADSLARPGSNLTGLSLAYADGMGGKWLELLRELVPRVSTVAVVGNLDNLAAAEMVKELEAAAPRLRLSLRIFNANTLETLERGMSLARQQSQAAVVLPDTFLMIQRRRVIDLAAKHRLPAIYGLHDFVDSGGLIAYAPDMVLLFRRAADYVDKILTGTPPGELPIEEPRQMRLTVNLRTAKELGVQIPESILLQAQEVVR